MKQFNSLKKRIFLVGCPRSGTTLLQSLLTAHPQITSFPESHFFRHLVPYDLKRYWLGIAPEKARTRFKTFLEEINREELVSYLPYFPIFQYQYIQTFLRTLDTITQEQGKNIWIEKTPGHVRNIDYIKKHIPEAKFIHIIRNGPDVVASLYEVTHKYPEIWRGAWNIDRCITQWIEDVQISLNHQNKPDHILVQYEHLVQNPRLIISKICDFLNVSFDEIILEKYMTKAQNIVLENEPWKRSVSETIQNRNGQKFTSLFDLQQQSYILEQLSEVMSKFNDESLLN
jgi:hypothetical protein